MPYAMINGTAPPTLSLMHVSMLPLPPKIGHLQDPDLVLHEMEFPLTQRPVLMQHGAQGYGAFPKFPKCMVRVICFLGLSHLTSSPIYGSPR